MDRPAYPHPADSEQDCADLGEQTQHVPTRDSTTPLACADGVSVTIAPAQDVTLRRGRPLAELRPELARCTGRPELAAAALFVGECRLDAHHVAGHPPLVSGAVVSTVSSPRDPAEHALAAAAHMAVLSGPGGGKLVALEYGIQQFPTLGAEVRLRRSRGAAGRAGAVRVQVRRGKSGGSSARLQSWRYWAQLARRPGSGAAGPRLDNGRGRPHRVHRCWVRWAPTSVLWTGQVRGQLRLRPTLSDWAIGHLIPALTAHPAPPEPVAERAGPPQLAALAPALGGLGLALVLRNPLFALMALTTPLMILGPRLVRRLKRRGSFDAARTAARTMHPDTPQPPPDLVRTGLCPRAGLHPVDLLTAAAAAAAIPESAVPRLSPRDPPGRRTGRPDLSLLGGLPDGAVSVTGPRPQALALARRMTVSLHALGRAQVLTVLRDEERADDWAWTRWLPGAQSRTPGDFAKLATGDEHLLVVDSAVVGSHIADLGAWHAAHGSRAAVLVIGPDSVPSWCSARAVATPQGTKWTTPGCPDGFSPPDTQAPDWFEDYARRVAGLVDRRRWVTAPGAAETAVSLPSAAALADQPGITDVEGRWRSNAMHRSAPGGDTLSVQLGIGADAQAVVLDLVRDGPHALIAGTTGSGKSELLQTIILGLALSYSPDDLAIALVDYKGGASFGACADLPHVVGQVTDLDPGAASRALAGLQAELRRRERLVAAAGVTSLRAFHEQTTADRRADGGAGEPVPRLLVVVDEFRAMADDQPDFIPGLVRIAAQGRSLGVHLILATQRPSGAITADMRANISLRIALRVVDSADSRDVIDSDSAAHIAPQTPGRALLRRGLSDPEPVQTYYAGADPSGTTAAVRHASGWTGAGPVRSSAELGSGTGREGSAARSLGRVPEGPRPNPQPAEDGMVHRLVSLTHRAMTSLAIRPPRVPWTPELPTIVPWEALAGPLTTGLPLGLADHPHEQRQLPFCWDPSQGHLLLLGRAGSGRTTALRTLAHAGVRAGLVVHLVGATDLAAGLHETDKSPCTAGHSATGLGTVVSRTDPRRLARLLTLLCSGAPTSGGVKHLVLLDGLEDVQPALGTIQRGAGLELLISALRDGLSRGVAFAVAGAVQPATSITALLRVRLTFSGAEVQDDLILGVPKALAGRGGNPGRAVVQVGGDAPDGMVRCQIAVPPPISTAPDGVSCAARIVPIPHLVNLADLPGTFGSTADGLVLVGLGGDDGTAVGLPAAGSLLVCGPHGSGRTTVLRHLAEASAAAGSLLGVLGREPSVREAAERVGAPTLAHLTAAAATDWIARIADGAAHRNPISRPARIIVDDLDTFSLTCPVEADRLHALLGTKVDIVASATTAAAAGAFRGLLAELRATRRGVVLTPATVSSSEVFGVDLGWFVEPTVDVPGRGVLISGRDAMLLQIAKLPMGNAESPS